MECDICKQDVKSLHMRYIPEEERKEGDPQYTNICPECVTNWDLCHNCHTIKGVSSITVVGCDSFTPHYDTQLGKFFQNKEEKQRHLDAKGYAQSEGPASPRRTSGKGEICMSKDQYIAGKRKL